VNGIFLAFEKMLDQTHVELPDRKLYMAAREARLGRPLHPFWGGL